VKRRLLAKNSLFNLREEGVLISRKALLTIIISLTILLVGMLLIGHFYPEDVR